MEMNGVNYLIPVDARIARDIDVEDEAISLDRIIRTIEPARRLQLVILDACRDNPFVRSMRRTIVSRSLRSGHGDIDERALPPNTLIAYAQKAGDPVYVRLAEARIEDMKRVEEQKVETAKRCCDSSNKKRRSGGTR
jgi:uncharacterized caspase-like protein